MGNDTGVLPLEDGQLQHQINHPNSMRPIGGYEPQFHHISIAGELFNHHQQRHPQLQVPPYRAQGMIPPTPTSMEMHGDQPRYYHTAGDHHPQGLYDRFGTNMKDQVRSIDARGFEWHGLIPFSDNIHPLSLPGGHALGYAISISRVCCARRVLQPVDIAGIRSPKQCRSNIGLRSSTTIRHVGYDIPH